MSKKGLSEVTILTENLHLKVEFVCPEYLVFEVSGWDTGKDITWGFWFCWKTSTITWALIEKP